MLPHPWQNFAVSFFAILLLGSPTFFMGKSQADKLAITPANLSAKNSAPNGPEPKKVDPRQIAAFEADQKAEAERQAPLSNVKEASQTKKDISAIKSDKKINPSKNEISDNDFQQKYTYEKYNQIINGLDYTQVKAILGDDGEEISRKNLGINQAFVFEWKNSDSSMITIKMINYVVVEKTQSGLKKTNTTVQNKNNIQQKKGPTENNRNQKFSHAMYSKIIPGLDYTQVKAILGDDGEEVSRKNLGIDQAFVFEWKNSDSSVITIKMINYVVVEKTQSGLKKASN